MAQSIAWKHKPGNVKNSRGRWIHSQRFLGFIRGCVFLLFCQHSRLTLTDSRHPLSPLQYAACGHEKKQLKKRYDKHTLIIPFQNLSQSMCSTAFLFEWLIQLYKYVYS